MDIIRDRGSAQGYACEALAIGNFDGVHLGHQRVIATMVDRARSKGGAPAVLTFSPHPRRFFNPNLPVLSIETMAMRLRRLRAMGVKTLMIRHFDAQVATLSADDFMREVLHNYLRVEHVVTGENFVFGHKRGGDKLTLAQGAQQYGFVYQPVASVMLGEEVCASTLVRGALAEGDVLRAGRYLGRPYEIIGTVRHGDKRGRELGFPTANIPLPRIFAPAFGVYVVRFAIVPTQQDMLQDEGLRWLDGVANLGLRPTFGGSMHPRLEVHAFAPLGDVYGKTLRVRLLHFLRPEQRFDNMAMLKAHIADDCERAKLWLAH
jgi:riboflavin kinase / FMN adenylyltransferase